MILERTPLTLNEVEEILKDLPESEKKQEMDLFLKKFIKIKSSEASKMILELEKLDLVKLKKEHIIKIVDLLPEDTSDIIKIFNDLSLSEDETNRILDIVKKS